MRLDYGLHGFTPMLSHLALRQLRGEEASVGDMFNFEGMFWQHCLAGSPCWLRNAHWDHVVLHPGSSVHGFDDVRAIPDFGSEDDGSAGHPGWATKRSREICGWHSLFVFVINIVASLGTFACCIGYLVSYPMYPLSVGVLYRDYFMQNDMRMSNPMGGVTDFTQPPR